MPTPPKRVSEPIVKRFRLLKATSLLLLAMVVAGIVADELRPRILKRYSDRYQRDVADFREKAASYRRLMLFGDPLEGNAAVWYQQSFVHVRTMYISQLADVARGGFTHYANTVIPSIVDECSESESNRIHDALRCTHCNWDLSPDGVLSLEHSREALVLGHCLTVLGHRTAYRRHRPADLRQY